LDEGFIVTGRDAAIRMQSSYRWVIVAAGGLLGCVAIGAMFSLPVSLLPISRETGWSVTGVSSASVLTLDSPPRNAPSSRTGGRDG